jgi:hypothetical protein
MKKTKTLRNLESAGVLLVVTMLIGAFIFTFMYNL